MRKAIFLSILMLMPLLASAQTQQGVVKTRGRMINGVLQPGRGLPGATVQVQGRQAVVSNGADGRFSFPVTGGKYRIEKVQKQGYQLVDNDVCREHSYSKEPLPLVMETPEQQQSDLLAAERKIRRNLQRQLQEREDEIEGLKVSQQEKDSLLRILYQLQGDNEKLITDMAKRYSTLDYDQLDEFYRQVSWFIENGELTRADSLLRTRGDVNTQVAEQLQRGKAIQEQKEQLQKAEAVHQADNEELARRCYGYYETFQAQHQNDSAAYYLELRAALDTTNVEWQDIAGDIIHHFLANYPKALTYYQRGLQQSILQYGEQSKWTATFYNGIGLVYHDQGDYAKALEYHGKALAIREKVLGTEHPDVAQSYNNIGGVYDYDRTGDNAKALEYYGKALTIWENVLGSEHPLVATSYNNIGGVYYTLRDYPKALEYYGKALAIREKVLGTEHLSTATSYNNISGVYMIQANYAKALEYCGKALAIYEKVLGTEHPHVATLYSNIGLIYSFLRNYSIALEYFDKALAIQEKVLGKEHPDSKAVRDAINLIKIRIYNYQNEKP